mmetsp:Transcript_19453/g.34692  ORF Transcript_19453/g.34692 Transcript_19453/m.34692 type:complete len:106 (+) Transcript_19453:48-365(+)|eukprot:CAMPEP_0184511996 /NCGR_PEP_ID=MMETSP0198_2-20121128/2647_1 /TAXON_ID=1112570 /ORGANISM="Thraustochytrium sp., Strain LLF1b" /LENGTH=105 /DNA_ID=CAMNT_0026901995 /DNA_START=16 /DNA_END=333 /DNA_ORIENTATION=-
MGNAASFAKKLAVDLPAKRIALANAERRLKEAERSLAEAQRMAAIKDAEGKKHWEEAVRIAAAARQTQVLVERAIDEKVEETIRHLDVIETAKHSPEVKDKPSGP